ncbi:MAG: peptidylprolyl isomerase [Acidobacteria bacterium]|nr:MAG: peptidylprolyl isomerase [Acidobacteriota bacterium]
MPLLLWLFALVAQAPPQQAVVETNKGTFVMALLPDKAPNHVAAFIKTARAGGYNGTIFHRVIRYGIIQGGDPLSKDPAKVAQYGTGGMNQLKAEFTDDDYSAGTVAAVLAPGKPDSGGAQFFICVTDQKGLTGHYTIFAKVVEGIEVVQEISAAPANANGLPTERIVITNVTIRDTPPPPVVPFSTEAVAELAQYRAVLTTTKGEITLKVRPDLAPETVRNFLRMAEAGVYDDTLFHRVVKDFVIQTGSPSYRGTPLTQKQAALVHNLQPEFTATPNLPGVVSMARGDDPASATSSFFICTGQCRALDNQYTVFAEVESGLDVVKAIEAVAVNGEAPAEPVKVVSVRVRRAP